MTILKTHKELLPEYLDGPNIRRHCEIVDKQSKKIHSMIDLTSLMYDVERPILFGSDTVQIHTLVPIKKITFIQLGEIADSKEIVEYLEEEMVTDESFSVSDFSFESFDIVRVETYDEVVYERNKNVTDPFLDNMGVLTGVLRKNDETDLEHQSRIKYFCSHFGKMDLALLMLYLIYNVTESDIFSTSSEMNRLVVRDWGVTDYDEVKNFSDKYCPITRPLLVVPPIKVKKVTTEYIQFEEYYPEEMIEDAQCLFLNLNEHITDFPEYSSPRKLVFQDTNIFDRSTSSFPVYSCFYANFGDDNFYLQIFRAHGMSYVARKEFYGDEASDRFNVIYNNQSIPDEWFPV